MLYRSEYGYGYGVFRILVVKYYEEHVHMCMFANVVTHFDECTILCPLTSVWYRPKPKHAANIIGSG